MNDLLSQRIASTLPLAFNRDLHPISFADFWQDVAEQAAWIAQRIEPVWALWEQDSYDFLVLFFAALQAGKHLRLPPHKVAQLEQQFKAESIYFLSRQEVDRTLAPLVLDVSPNFAARAQIDFYTSGSTGEPKLIARTLEQLLLEVIGLHATFAISPTAVSLATVSHQHIYGLLFKVLWPLVGGRSFYAPQLTFPEEILAVQNAFAAQGIANILISSPALLKRWPADHTLSRNEIVFSSGGKLDDGVRAQVDFTITEILGSSETGGIAFRDQDLHPWRAFDDVQIRIDQQHLMVQTAHAHTDDWIITGDLAVWADSDHLGHGFHLGGRADRLIKLEEKRLSLDAIEQTIATLPWVKQCHALLIDRQQRQLLACIVVLHDEAHQQLSTEGKQHWVAKIKQALQEALEPIAIPRLWRFLTELPHNTQSKLDHRYLKRLFEPMQQPVILQRLSCDEAWRYRLEFVPELECFKGHFPNQPVYPGVALIGCAEAFAREVWPDLVWCNGYEQVKFQQAILPYSIVELTLIRKANKISYTFAQAQTSMATGRLSFIETDLGQDV